MSITGRAIKVMVAQTSFAAFNQLVTISMGARSFVCGGDNLFFGLQGANDKCDAYYTCYDGVAYSTDIEITFSRQVDGSTCTERAVVAVLVSDRDTPQTVTCDTLDRPFNCVPSGQCLGLSTICDGNPDCTDGTDEGSCSNWNFVKNDVRPTCTSSPHTMQTTQLSVCQRWAVAKRAKSFTLSSAGGCKAYDCLNFDDPDLEDTTNTTDAGSQLYIQTSDPTSFKLCTDALHCSNNGRVLSTTSPCQCSCDVQYIGDHCESIRDISLIESLFIIFPAGSTLNSTVLTAAIQAASSRVIDPLTVVAIKSIRTSPQSTAVELSVTNSLTGAQSVDVRTLLSPPVARAIVADLAAFGAIRLTATSVVGNDVSVACTFANLTGDPFGNLCERITNINQTQSITITVPAITFSDAAQWVYLELVAYDGEVTPLSCNNTDFVRTVNPLLDGPCAVSSSCTKILDRVGAIEVRIYVSPRVNPTAQYCTAGRLFESTVQVSGFITLPDARIDTAAEYSTTYNGSLFLLAILLFILGGLAVLHLIVWILWMRKRFKSVKYLGPIAAALSFFLLLGGAISYGVYLDSADSQYSHLLLIEEYRDDQCEASEFAFVPARASYVQVTEGCAQLNVIGEAQGVEYVAARIPNGTLDVVEVKRGGTMDTCASARWQRLRFRQCSPQSLVFSDKPVADQLYMQMISLPKAVVLQRVNAIREFNPPILLSSTAKITAVPAEDQFNKVSGQLHLHQEDQSGDAKLPSSSPRAAAVKHMLVPTTGDLTEAVLANESDVSRVRYIAEFTSKRTLFTAPRTSAVNTIPYLSVGSRPTDFENVGILFNGYLGGSALTEYRSVDAFRDAQRYEGIGGTFLDLGAKTDDFTLTFWMRASANSRGMVFAATDDWVTTAGELPTVTRLITIIENGEQTTQWYNNPAEVYASLYVDGVAKAMNFVHTVNGKMEIIVWDTQYIGVERVFDGAWHFIALEFVRGKTNHEVQLFVDGQTSYTDEGWRRCIKSDLGGVQARTVGENVYIYNPREETFRSGGVFVLGHANVGLYDFAVHDSALAAEEIVRFGAEGMDHYATVARAESITLGVLLAILALVLVVATLYEVWNHFFGVSTDILVDQNKNKIAADKKKAQTRGGYDATAAGSTRGELLIQFINPVIGVSQSMALYLAAWQWPNVFVNTYGAVYAALSLDLFDLIPDIPVLVVPAVQFCLAIVALFALFILAVRDEDVYAQVLAAYHDRKRSADRAFTRRLELDRPKPEYNWVIYDENSDKVSLTAEQEDFLLRGLHDLLTSSHRKAKNMRLHSRTILEFPDIGFGILLYERRDGDIGIFFRQSHDQRLNEIDIATNNIETKQSNRITMTQYTFECVAKNTICPLHERRLLKSELEGLSCVHNESPYYRSVACNSEAAMYQCPEEDCMYAVCDDCWKHGAGVSDSALTGAMSTLADMRRKGIWKAASTIVIVVALVMYLPVTKNAMLILTCHPSFQCEFGACWSNPDMKYLISVLLCIITVAFIGVGLIVLQAVLLYRRQTSLLHELPVHQVIRKWNMPCRSNHIVLREDYDEFLAVDESMLKALYSVFDFQHLLFGPVYLLYKAAIIISVVGTQPRSLTQLFLVSIFESIFAILLVVRSPYKNVFIEAVSRVSSLHQLVMLALTCFHRLAIADGNEGYGDQMILTVAVYAGLVVLIGLGIVLSPWLRRVCLRDSLEQQLEKELEEEDTRIAREKEERKRARDNQQRQAYKDNGEGRL
jgi:hypothetical protein